ncbi:MAG: biotin-dependent carboxyltransferase family protein [Opitutae bacterium]|nr:biotin-dependent carboxyltransferase family protein [Opitutae bacterium]
MITVLKGGAFTTVQDLGRPGHQRDGVSVGGAVDGLAARVANLLVGNSEGAALLEMTLQGPELVFEEETLLAWCGGGFAARLGAEDLPKDRPVRVPAGGGVAFGAARSGARAWLAVAGGIDVPLVLGSRSTYRRAGFGGHEGRTLKAGDRLPCGAPSEWARPVLAALRNSPRTGTAWSVRPETLGKAAPEGTVRAMRGPEWEWFGAEAQRRFFETPFAVTKDADRMGLCLTGPALATAKPREMISDAVNTGVVQVPPSGQPVVLLTSRQTVGGYPRIAAVAAVDTPRLAQLRPGDALRFEEISLATAHELYIGRERDLNRVRAGLARLTG